MNIKALKLTENAILPTQAKESDAGYDLYSVEDVKLKPFERRIIRTGIAIEIPEGYYGRVAPRSGLAVKKGIDVLAGVVDSGYRNEVGVVLINFNVLGWLASLFADNAAGRTFQSLFGSNEDFDIRAGDRIAQIIIEPCAKAEWKWSDKLSDSERGQGGIGSTGR